MDTGVLQVFRDTANAARGASSVDGYCQATIGYLAALLDVRRCSILLRRPGHMHHAAAVGLSAEYVRTVDGLELRPDLGSCGPAMLTGRATISADIVADERWAPLHDICVHDDLRACWSVPLRPGGGPTLGSLGIYRDVVGEPTSDELALAEALADVLALGIEAIGHQQQAARSSAATVQALTAALDARDHYTAGHSAATAAFATAVGQRLGLSDEELMTLARAAELHDIGKLAVPDSILHHPLPLDPEQDAIMRTHPVVGAEILSHVPGFDAVVDVVRHEHERWDGKGYPDGLAGEDIPIGSRIILACDALHAMTSDRPYRRAMPVETARAELLRHAGTQFDPRVVAALLALNA